MSATVHPIRPLDPLTFTFPPGLPPSLYADPIVIDSAADAVGVLAGLQWDAMTPQQRDDARAWATLAATCLHTDGLKLAAYSVGKTHVADFVLMPAIVRSGVVGQLMAAIRGAASRVWGVCSPKEHAGLVALIRDDDAAAAGRWGRR